MPVADSGRAPLMWEVVDTLRMRVADTPEARAGSFAGIGFSSSTALRLRVAPVVVGTLSGELAARGILDILF